MDNNYDNLTRLFDQLKAIGLWGRIFHWKRIKNLVIDAAGDMQRLQMTNDGLTKSHADLKTLNTDLVRDKEILSGDLIKKTADLERLMMKEQESTGKISGLSTKLSVAESAIQAKQERIHEISLEFSTLKEKSDQVSSDHNTLSEKAAAFKQTVSELSHRKTELEIELASIKKDLETKEKELGESKLLVSRFESNEEGLKKAHSEQVNTLKEIRDGIQADRQQEVSERHLAEIARLENQKLTWSNHEETVRQTIKTLCSKHTIHYVEKVPFKGTPDNTLNIANEFIIFDAKSPRGDDLSNFPVYIKEQSEKAKKYAEEENVKKWIFFVVPSNTLEGLKTFVYPLADYEVFVITIDALEPVILSLRKIEEYDFADQMNPEDRENICRVLGKFAHLSKRRIQIDTYFINQFMELAYKAESDLPQDILDKVMEFEKAEKLNPPQEKRAKAISLRDLEKSTRKLRDDANSKGIMIEDGRISTGLNELPLYKPNGER